LDLYTPDPILVFEGTTGARSGEREIPMEERLLDNLIAVYEHMDRKRQRLKKEYDEVEGTLAGIRKEIAALRDFQPQLFPDEDRPERMVYQNISMRWAILWFLNEKATGPVQTPFVADALRHGGVAERPNFNSIVSAILSQMVNKGEVAKSDGAFILTHNGASAWEAIRRSEKFLNRHSLPNLKDSEDEFVGGVP
jgi:hypothetical protein